MPIRKLTHVFDGLEVSVERGSPGPLVPVRGMKFFNFAAATNSLLALRRQKLAQNDF